MPGRPGRGESTARRCSRNNIEAVNLANEGDQAKNSNIDEAISEIRAGDEARSRQRAHLVEARARVREEGRLAEDGERLHASRRGGGARGQEEDPRRLLLLVRATRFGAARRKRRRRLGRREGAVSRPRSSSTQLRRRPTASSRWCCIHADDEAGAIQNWTKALQIKPDETQYYVDLADEYRRLMFYDQAEQVLREGTFVREGRRQAPLQHARAARRRLRDKGDYARAVTEYEAAKKSCDSNKCNDHKEAYFNLGAAYSELKPPKNPKIPWGRNAQGPTDLSLLSRHIPCHLFSFTIL